MSAIPTGRAAEFADLVAPVDKQGAQVNPATEDTLAAVVTAQATLEAKIDTLLQKLQNGDTKVVLYGSNMEVLEPQTVSWNNEDAVKHITLPSGDGLGYMLSVDHNDRPHLYFRRNRPSWVEVPHDPRLSGLSALTIEVWINRAPLESGTFPLACKHRSGTDGEYGLFLRSHSARIQFTLVNENNERLDLTRTGYPTLGAYAHVAGTYDGSTASILVNGVTEVSDSFSGKLALRDSIPFTIGRDSNNNGFDGAIAKVRLWNVARTPQEIADSMNIDLPDWTPGLIGQWLLDEMSGDVAHDSTLNGLHGNVINPVWGGYLDMSFSLLKNGVWRPWYDGQGNRVACRVRPGSGVYGPFSSMLKYEQARIELSRPVVVSSTATTTQVQMQEVL